MAESGTGITRQAKGIFIGAAFIAWGVIGALVSYYNDRNSLDLFRMLGASQGAVLHLVLWLTVGIGVVLWYWVGPGASPGQDRNEDQDLGI